MLKRPLFLIIIALLITNVITLVLLNKSGDVLLDNEERIMQKEPVASIGREKIYYKDWISLLRNDYGKKHLQKLIDRSVVNQLAEEKNIQIDQKLIDHGVSLLATMQGVITEKEFNKLEEKWREDLLYQHQLGEILAEGITVSQEDIQQHYNQYRKQYDFSASIQLSHIVVKDMDIAKKVVQELDEGALFHLLAMEYSTDAETKGDGGYLGYLTKGSQSLPADYYEVATDMKEGSYSKSFETEDGASVIYLHRKLPEISFSYEEIESEIRRELALSKSEQTSTADSLWKEFDINWIYEP